MSIKYDSVDLNTPTDYLPRDLGHLSMSPRDLNILGLAERSGGKFLSSQFKPKKLEIVGNIFATTQALFEQKRDELLELFSRESKNLDVDYRSGTRRYKCVCQDVEIPTDFFNIKQAAYKAILIAYEGFARSTVSESETIAGITTSPYADSFTIIGSHETLPVITITVNSETTMTEVKLSTDATADELVIPYSYTAADVLIINFENSSILINGVVVDYSGIFPRWPVGTVNYTLTCTAAARNVDLDITYPPLWL